MQSLWKRQTGFLASIILCISLNAQTVSYSFNYDEAYITKADEGKVGKGQLVIYSNGTAVYKASVNGHSINRSISIKSASSFLDGAVFCIYSSQAGRDEKDKYPYIIINGDGDYAFFYEGEIHNGADSYSLSLSDTRKGQNANAMQQLLNDFDNRRGIFSGFSSVSDLELPLKIEGFNYTRTITVPGSGEEKAYSVRTKTGKLVDESSIGDYEVESDSYWAKIKVKTNAAFLLDTEANTTGQLRTANIYVKANGKTTQLIVNQPSTTAQITNVWVEHNKWSGIVKGMKIHVAFNTFNVRGMMGQCAAYFNFENGQKLIDYNMQYRAIDGQVCCFQNFTPNYDYTTYNDLVLFMPYTELHINGHADCKFNVQVNIGGQGVSSDFISFTFN